MSNGRLSMATLSQRDRHNPAGLMRYDHAGDAAPHLSREEPCKTAGGVVDWREPVAMDGPVDKP